MNQYAPPAASGGMTGPYSQQQQPSAVVPILPKPDPPTKPHAQSGLETYYPKGHFIHGDLGTTASSVGPPVTGRAVILDDGNASPHIWASSMYVIPQDSTTLRHTGLSSDNEIPLFVNPLALPSQEYMSYVGHADHLPDSGRLGYIALATEEPERCSKCLAYANPLQTSGICNFCNAQTASSRKNVGTVDYPVDGPYITRASPVRPNVVWAIDLTAPNSLEDLNLLLEQVLPVWVEQQQQSQDSVVSTRAGIVLVSSQGVYVPTPATINGAPASFVTMSDTTEDPFSPLPLEAFTHDLRTEWSQMQTMWQDLLDESAPSSVPQLLAQIRQSNAQQQQIYEHSCGGAALGMMVDALQTSGGRAVWVSWRRPNYGAGKLVDRQGLAKQDAYGAKEHTLYTPSQENSFYSSLATTASKSQVAVDIVLFTDPSVPKAFMDVATMQQICQTTNGRLTWITSQHDWPEALAKALVRPLQFTGWDAVLKIRVSSGLRVKRLDSSVGIVRQAGRLIDDSPELELAVVTPDTSVGVYLQHRVGGISKNTQFVYIQSALLYTNPWNGKRRVRVSTLALRVASNAQQVFSSMEFHTLAASILRQTVAKVRALPAKTESIQAARVAVKDQCISILVNYRKYGASINSQASSNSQLMLPDKLTLLPLLCMSLLKSPLLRASLQSRRGTNTVPDPLADDRAYYLYHASQTSPTMALWMVYPWIVDLHSAALKRWQHPGRNLPEDAHRLDILKQAPYLSVAEPIMASMSELQDDHSYLLVTPLKFYVVIGKDVSPQEIQEIEDVVAGDKKDDDTDDPSIGGNLQRLLKQARVWSQVGKEPRWLRPTWDTIELARPEQISSFLVADPTPLIPDYANFLSEIQQKVLAATSK